MLLQENEKKISLDKCHDYNIQVQGQILATGAPRRDFIVYTTKKTQTCSQREIYQTLHS